MHRRNSTSFSLGWGKLITLASAVARAKRLPRTKVPKYMGQNFKPEWAFTIAKRSDLRERFLDFDRRAKAINRARAVVHLAFRFLKTSFCKVFKQASVPACIPSGIDPEGYREVPDLPLDGRALGLPAMFDRFIRSAWMAAYSLGLAKEEISIVAREVADNPSAAGIRLEIAESKLPTFLRSIYWVHLPTGTEVPKLTHASMRRLRVKEAVRPVLTQKELKRRRIAGSLSETAKALDSLRQRCAAAQAAVSGGLTEAKGIHIQGQDGGERRVAS
jgi:hypothetical protein